MKSVRIRRYSGPYFPVFGLNNSESEHFLRSVFCFFMSEMVLAVFVSAYIMQQSLHKKMKFSIKYFFSKYDQIRMKLRIWSYLLKKSLMENFIFVQ